MENTNNKILKKTLLSIGSLLLIFIFLNSNSISNDISIVTHVKSESYTGESLNLKIDTGDRYIYELPIKIEELFEMTPDELIKILEEYEVSTINELPLEDEEKLLELLLIPELGYLKRYEGLLSGVHATIDSNSEIKSRSYNEMAIIEIYNFLKDQDLKADFSDSRNYFNDLIEDKINWQILATELTSIHRGHVPLEEVSWRYFNNRLHKNYYYGDYDSELSSFSDYIFKNNEPKDIGNITVENAGITVRTWTSEDHKLEEDSYVVTLNLIVRANNGEYTNLTNLLEEGFYAVTEDDVFLKSNLDVDVNSNQYESEFYYVESDTDDGTEYTISNFGRNQYEEKKDRTVILNFLYQDLMLLNLEHNFVDFFDLEPNFIDNLKNDIVAIGYSPDDWTYIFDENISEYSGSGDNVVEFSRILSVYRQQFGDEVNISFFHDNTEYVYTLEKQEQNIDY